MTPGAEPPAAAVARLYDAAAGDYDARYGTPLDRAEDAVLHGELRRLGVGAGRPVLDLGCGTGALLRQLPSICRADYLGVDVSDGMLRRAAELHPGYAFLQADLDGPDWPTRVLRHFGALRPPEAAVAMWGPLSYSTNPDLLLARLRRVLAPGALVYAAVYGPAHPGLRGATNSLSRRWAPAPLEALGARHLDGARVRGFGPVVDRLARGVARPLVLRAALRAELALPPTEAARWLVLSGRVRGAQ